MTSASGTSVVSWAARGLAVLAGLVLPLALTSPVSAETGVVKDDTRDGGLRSMTVKRTPSGLEVVTYFTEASDLHQLRVREPGYRKPTFRISWRSDVQDTKLVRVDYARRTATREPGEGSCGVRRATYEPGSTTMRFTLPPSCLWKREFEEIERYQVNQNSYDVTDGVRTQTDKLVYTRLLTRKRPDA